MKALFINAYAGSWYTITGCGGDITEWEIAYNNLLGQHGIGSDIEWHKFTGREYNEAFHLTGDNRYPDDLVFLCFPLDALNVGKLAMFKMMMGDRWFDDIVDNDLRREGTNYAALFGDYLGVDPDTGIRIANA